MTNLQTWREVLDQNNFPFLTLEDVAHVSALREDFYRYHPNTGYSLNSVTAARICRSLGISIKFDVAPYLMVSIEGDTIWLGLKMISKTGGRKITTACQTIKLLRGIEPGYE